MANDVAKALLDDACKRLQDAMDARRKLETIIVKKGETLYSVQRKAVKA